MKQEQFIVLHTTGDGDNYISFMTEKQIRTDFFSDPDSPPEVFDKLPEIGYCGEGILIIKGKIIVPKPKDVVKDWEF